MSKYWLTPPDILKAIENEFGPTFDPCPYPRPENYDSLNIEWGNCNYINPPFNTKHGEFGPTRFIKKAIEQKDKGKTSIIIIPTLSTVNMLLEAGAEPRSMGRIPWIDAETGKPWNKPSCCTMFILKP